MIERILFIAALVGHFALHLAIYNRLNATGMRRVTIKRIVKLFIVTCVVIPPLAIWNASPTEIFTNPISAISLPVKVYGLVCLASLVVFGIPWLFWRPILALESIDARRDVRMIDVQKLNDQPLHRSVRCRVAAGIPGNQIFELAVENVELPVHGLPTSLDGLRVSHFSDLHFTGDISADFVRQAVIESNRWSPDLCVITGDLIDKATCIGWLREVFHDAIAPSGKFFVLGNHDKRIADPNDIRRPMEAIGWVNVGGRVQRIRVRDTEIDVIGNEYPWFARPVFARPVFARPVFARLVFGTPTFANNKGSSADFRLLLSHSPDQLSWAREHGIELMLAGHTHGGQGRLPIAGPLLSPSWHGSRFASGDFYKPPTTMHVTRGLGGVHLLRINCRPELSLLTLRSIPSRES